MTSSASAPDHAYVGVSRLYAEYARAMDASDAQGVSSLFVEDGVFEIVGLRTIEGRAALEDMVRATAEGRPLHTFANLVVSADVDATSEVDASAYFFIISRETGQTLAYGEYRDRCGRAEDGRWQFLRRAVRVDWQSAEYAARDISGSS